MSAQSDQGDGTPGRVENGVPVEGTLWERDDEVYKVLMVYEATQSDGNGGFAPVTLVKFVLVDPAPWHANVRIFRDNYTPYDPEAD